MPQTRRFILYDGNCVICRRLKHLALQYLSAQAGSWACAPIQDYASYPAITGVSTEQALDHMHVYDSKQHYHGYDAICFIACRSHTASLLWKCLRAPIIKHIGHAIYQWVAHHRPCQTQCPIHR